MDNDRIKKPEWLKVPFNKSEVDKIGKLMDSLRLNTVCREANCPNIGECAKHNTATFMIMGKYCTRNCRFCNVTCHAPEELDDNEPNSVAEAAKELKLKHVVVTSVTRDDLPDYGAQHFARTITAIRRLCDKATVEVLIPDLKGDERCIDIVTQASPDVLNHNVETVFELYSQVRPQAQYERSLNVLKYAKETSTASMLVKTGFMVGLGETEEQIKKLISDIAETGCDILTIGQYLQPSSNHAPLVRYATPEEFKDYKRFAEEVGIKYVVSHPLARSSYMAAEALSACNR